MRNPRKLLWRGADPDDGDTRGTRARRHVVVGLQILARRDDTSKSKNRTRWQVASVEDRRIAEIRGYENRRDAVTFATSGVTKWNS